MGPHSSTQIPLAFGNYQQNDFDSFLPGENQALIRSLQSISEKAASHQLYLWGVSGIGKTHLLQACCKHANDQGHQVAYIPLKQHQEISPEMLHDLGHLDLVCVDDIDCVVGEIEWQQGLTWLYNELRDNDFSMIISALASPNNSKLEVDDLKSRLAWDQVMQLQAPDDELKIDILKQKAQSRSFELGDDVIDYLIRRVDRDLPSLIKVLDKIDHASLVAKRKVTIPFVKELIS